MLLISPSNLFISVFRTPRENVRSRTRNTMSGMVASALERRINEALNDLTDEEIQRLDRSTSRLGLERNGDRDRIVEF